VHKDFVFGRVSMRGTVRDAGLGRPIQGAHVFLSTKDVFRNKAITDAEGAYRFLDFPSRGQPMVVIEKSGYAKRIERIYIRDDETRVLDIELVRAVRIKVLFTDSSGNPIPGRHRLSLDTPGKSQGASVTTDGDGWGVIEAVTPDVYQLEVDVVGYVHDSQEVDATGDGAIVRFRLEPEDTPKRAELRGVVRDATTNQPIGGVRVWFGTGTTAVTNNRGEFAFEKVWMKDKEFRLTVERDGYAPLRHMVKDRAAPQDISLQPAVRLRLRILDKHGDPVPGERAVYVFKSRQPPFKWVQQLETDEDGWVEYHGLVPAHYSMYRSGPAGDLRFRLDVPPEGIEHELTLGAK